MFEDFNYIADENFLEDYWSEEDVTCLDCQGTGKLLFNNNQISVCSVCYGLGTIKRKEQQKLVHHP